MNELERTIGEWNRLTALTERETFLTGLHPLAKLGVTAAYITAVVSFSAYDVVGLGAMFLYPLAAFLLGELALRACLYRLRLVLPIVAVTAAINLFLDKTAVSLGGVYLPGGWFSAAVLLLKGVYSVLAVYLLVASTKVEDLCAGLQQLHCPKVLVTQFLLTWRYLSLLLQEVNRSLRAYRLRAPGQKGLQFAVWGSFAGRLLLRSIDRAETVYKSMLLRGFDGTVKGRGGQPFARQDWLWLLLWLLLLWLLRRVPVLLLPFVLMGGN